MGGRVTRKLSSEWEQSPRVRRQCIRPSEDGGDGGASRCFEVAERCLPCRLYSQKLSESGESGVGESGGSSNFWS